MDDDRRRRKAEKAARKERGLPPLPRRTRPFTSFLSFLRRVMRDATPSALPGYVAMGDDHGGFLVPAELTLAAHRLLGLCHVTPELLADAGEARP
jgi:hypothetical protein